MKILVVDDDNDIRHFLKATLESESFVVDTADNGEQGSYLARTNEYGVIILDHILPKKTGLEVCKEIRASGKHTPILFLSVKSEISDKTLLLNAGADDYMTKPYSHKELVSRLRALLRRSSYLQPTILYVSDISLNTITQEVKRNNKEIYLTRKEFALLELLLKHKGKVISRGMIMEHVWNMEGDPLSKTIETHILNLRKKIEPKKHKIIHNVFGRGYKIIDP